MAINVTADPIVLTLDFRAIRTQWPGVPRNVGYDQELSVDPIIITITPVGTWLNVSVAADPITITLGVIGTVPGATGSMTVSASAIVITIGFSDIDIVLENLRKNFVQWSDIGHLDFTIGRDNVAGERPLDWAGWIYKTKKLNDKVVAYGENGVSILTPSDRFYGLKTVHRLGLLSQHAMTGTDDAHYFIDKIGQLWQFKESLELLDYSEFLSLMTNPVMSYDTENNLVYICDGTYGYIYSPKDKSLGKGPANVTGIGVKDGTIYIASPGAVATPAFEVCTDIYDMGTRKFKTVRSIEVGTDLVNLMEATIDYRVSNKVAFSTLDWTPVTLEGVAHIYCYGLEFRFRLRVQTYEYFELDYLKINGLIHNYSYTEHMLRSVNEQRLGYGS